MKDATLPLMKEKLIGQTLRRQLADQTPSLRTLEMHHVTREKLLRADQQETPTPLCLLTYAYLFVKKNKIDYLLLKADMQLMQPSQNAGFMFFSLHSAGGIFQSR